MSTTQSIVFVIVINNENIFKFVEGCFKTVREIDETVFGVNDRPRTGAGGGRICYSISLQGRFTSEAIRRKIVHSMSRRTRYAPKQPRYTIKGMEGERRKGEGGGGGWCCSRGSVVGRASRGGAARIIYHVNVK